MIRGGRESHSLSFVIALTVDVMESQKSRSVNNGQ